MKQIEDYIVRNNIRKTDLANYLGKTPRQVTAIIATSKGQRGVFWMRLMLLVEKKTEEFLKSKPVSFPSKLNYKKLLKLINITDQDIEPIKSMRYSQTKEDIAEKAALLSFFLTIRRLKYEPFYTMQMHLKSLSDELAKVIINQDHSMIEEVDQNDIMPMLRADRFVDKRMKNKVCDQLRKSLDILENG